MALKKVFRIFDSKAGVYMTPFFCLSVGVALRLVKSAAMDLDHDFSKFGADFTLFETGVDDDSTGRLETLDNYVNHGTALQIAALEEK